MSPATISPLSGSSEICPETKSKIFDSALPCEYGPIAAGALSVEIISLIVGAECGLLSFNGVLVLALKVQSEMLTIFLQPRVQKFATMPPGIIQDDNHLASCGDGVPVKIISALNFSARQVVKRPSAVHTPTFFRVGVKRQDLIL